MVEVARLEPSVQKIGETLFCDGPTYSFFGLTRHRFPLFLLRRLDAGGGKEMLVGEGAA